MRTVGQLPPFTNAATSPFERLQVVPIIGQSFQAHIGSIS
jgi:hypothetical protein